MKKIVFFFYIAIAFLCFNSFSAYSAEKGLHCRTTAHDIAIFDNLTDTENFIFDTYFEDISDDDESDDDNEGGKKPSEKTSKSNFSFVANYAPANRVINYLPTHFFFPLKTSLFIFIRVLRIWYHFFPLFGLFIIPNASII